MGFWDRITGRRPPERRYSSWDAIAAGITAAHPAGGIAPGLAEAVGTVTACVELIANTIASLPPTLVVDGPDGPVPAPRTAPAQGLLERVNEFQSWPAWACWATAQYLLFGNAVSFIRTDGRGAVTELVPVPWQWTTAQVVRVGTTPRLAFDVLAAIPELSLLDLPPRILSSDAIHVRNRSDTGLIGRSVLSRCPAPIREAVQQQQAAHSLWQNSLRPSAIFTAPNFIARDQRPRAREIIDEFSGAVNSGRVPLIEGGWTLTPFSATPADAQMIESRTFTAAEVCALFNVPELLLRIAQRLPSDMSTFTAQFATHCLRPIIRLIEAEFDHSVLPAGMHLRIDSDSLARGSFSATVAGLSALTQSGIITPNDARAELDWAPHPDGDALQRNGAPPSWPADAAGMPHMATSPGPRGDAPAEPGTNEDEGSGG
jgi:HK97 family phage portal protein